MSDSVAMKITQGIRTRPNNIVDVSQMRSAIGFASRGTGMNDRVAMVEEMIRSVMSRPQIIPEGIRNLIADVDEMKRMLNWVVSQIPGDGTRPVGYPVPGPGPGSQPGALPWPWNARKDALTDNLDLYYGDVYKGTLGTVT